MPAQSAISHQSLPITERVIKSTKLTRNFGNILPTCIKTPTRASKAAERIEEYQQFHRVPLLLLHSHRLRPTRQQLLSPCRGRRPMALLPAIIRIEAAAHHPMPLILWRCSTIQCDPSMKCIRDILSSTQTILTTTTWSSQNASIFEKDMTNDLESVETRLNMSDTWVKSMG